jgi:hypothetical protein
LVRPLSSYALTVELTDDRDKGASAVNKRDWCSIGEPFRRSIAVLGNSTSRTDAVFQRNPQLCAGMRTVKSSTEFHESEGA